MNFPSILLLAVALINVYLASSFSTNRVVLPTKTGVNNGLRLYATKEKAPVEERPQDKKGPGGKDVIRGILWATTPWIFNSYEVTLLLSLVLFSSSSSSSSSCSSTSCCSLLHLSVCLLVLLLASPPLQLIRGEHSSSCSLPSRHSSCHR